MNLKTKLSSILLTIATVAGIAVHTAHAQGNLELKINSFKQELLSSDNHTVYRQDVNIEIGAYHLKADEVSVFKINGQPDRIVAKGNPLTFKVRNEKGPGFAKVEAMELEYLVTDKKLVLRNYILVLKDGTTQKGKKFSLILE